MRRCAFGGETCAFGGEMCACGERVVLRTRGAASREFARGVLPRFAFRMGRDRCGRGGRWDSTGLLCPSRAVNRKYR